MARQRIISSTAMSVAAVSAVISAALVVFTGPAIARTIYQGGPSAVFGQAGTGNGQLEAPAGIAVDETSRSIYVADTLNGRVQEFDMQGKYLAQFDGSEAPSGPFITPYGVVVDNSSGPTQGHVFVSDLGRNLIYEFDSNGKYISQLSGTPAGGFAALEALAVDRSGDLWVYDTSNVDEFTSSGSYVGQFNTGRGTRRGLVVDSRGDTYLLFGCGCVGKYTPRLSSSEGVQDAEWNSNFGETEGVALALDPATNNVFVDGGNKIEEFGPFGQPYGVPVEVFATSGLSGSSGLAVDGATGTVFASQEAEDSVAAFVPLIVPDVSVNRPLSIQASSAILSGLVRPDGTQVTKCEFQYFAPRQSGSYDHSVPCATNPGSGTSAVEVTATAAGLMPNEYYRYRIVVGSKDGLNVSGSATFRTLPAPAISNVAVSDVAPGAATVSATVESNGLATSYGIDFGPDTSYGTHTAGQIAGLSQTVTLTLLYLKPSTTYHYRFTATNEGGTVASPDRTFTTPAYPILLPDVLSQVVTPAIAFPREGRAIKVKPKRKAAKHHGRVKRKHRHKKKK